jgi:hypothetical protein
MIECNHSYISTEWLLIERIEPSMSDFYLLKRHKHHRRELEQEANNERLARQALAYRRKIARTQTTQHVASPYRLILAWVGRRLIVMGARLQVRYGEIKDSAALAAVLDLQWPEQQEQSL